MNTESRREFEEWAKNSKNIVSPWEAWQAARERQGKYEEALLFLASQGCCWRNANAVENGWMIGEQTEWAYENTLELLVDRILSHKQKLRPNPPTSDKP